MAKQAQLTAPDITAMKQSGEKITVVTAYDFPTARLADPLADILLVGDSLGMVVQGHESTIPVTLDQMIYHAEMVARAARHALVVVDLPFPTFQLGAHSAIEASARILKETRAQAVKLEGGVQRAETIATLVHAGIPVMAHIGLLPQNVLRMGGYRVQRDADRLIADALAVEQAGAFSVVVECVPADAAARVTEQVSIPTIGIGAGPHCDGQVLVWHDMFGMTEDETPHHVRRYADLTEIIGRALARYRAEVRSGDFPGKENSFD